MTDQRADRRLQLIQIVDAMVHASGNPEGFDPAAWVDSWLRSPVPALGHKLPLDYLGSDEDCQILVQLLGRMQSGAYA
jgi:uncharacterized protein (DUF2384 family)